MMIMQADYISEELVQKAKDELIKKRKGPDYLEELKLKSIADGKAVLMMHIGRYDEVGSTVEKLLKEFKNNGLKPARNYREIYLSDPRRVAPEKLKTICRMPYE